VGKHFARFGALRKCLDVWLIEDKFQVIALQLALFIFLAKRQILDGAGPFSVYSVSNRQQ
jgi:hypothetical protein